MMHYLDNAATTRVYPEAVLRAAHVMNKVFGNPSSLHAMGKEAKAELERARASVAKAIGARPESLIFTSCGTEANNQAILTASIMARRIGKHAVVNASEHPSVLQSMRALESQGWEVTYLKPDGDGSIDPVKFEETLRPDTSFASVMLVNNETGAVNPICELRAAMSRHKCRAVLHCDAVQGLFKVPLTAPALGADLVTISAHKIHAMKGCGALWVRPGMKVGPLIAGGGQENGLRSGTEAMPAIAAFGAAAEKGFGELQDNARRVIELRRYLEGRVKAADYGVKLNFTGGVPHIASICLDGCRSEVVMRILSDREVYVSAGSACARGRRSHALMACGMPVKDIDCTLRVSMCEENTNEDIDALMDGLHEAWYRFHPKK